MKSRIGVRPQEGVRNAAAATVPLRSRSARCAAAALLALLGAFAGTAPAVEPTRAYWVWHRASALRAEEIAELQSQGVTTLWWNVGELELRAGIWRWKGPPLVVRGWAGPLRVIPVVRLSSSSKTPFAAPARAGLIELLTALGSDQGQMTEGRGETKPARVGEGPPAERTRDALLGELQLDFDCPDRLLGAYADFLRELRVRIPHLSITALAGWSNQAAFPALQASVSEITPMFYDLQADPTGVNADAPPPPLLDPAQVAAALKSWSHCAIPWRAGLPNFARMTVFDATGGSRGEIPHWSWEDVCFQRDLRLEGRGRLGVTLFRAERDTQVARTALKAGEWVASRRTDRAALAEVAARAVAAGAEGVTLFRLPDDTDAAGPSLRDLGQLAGAVAPQVVLRWKGDQQLELVNRAPVDLGPRLSGAKGDRDRGYALEIDAPGAIFREAEPGQFWRVASHAQPDEVEPARVPVALATRLTFWFSDLRAGARIESGLLQLAPGANRNALRYRIMGAEGSSAAWIPLNPP